MFALAIQSKNIFEKKFAKKKLLMIFKEKLHVHIQMSKYCKFTHYMLKKSVK